MTQNEESHQKRRRYRIPRSCDRCRASKIRCVFEDGKCTACVTARVPCTFANPGSLTQRPATQRDVEYLRARIRSLERLIHAIEPAFDLSSLPDLVESYHPKPYSKKPLGIKATNQQRISVYSSTPSQWDHHTLQKQLQISSEAHGPKPGPALAGLFFPTQIYLSTSAGDLPHSLTNVDDLSPVDKAIQQQQQQQTLDPNHRFYPEPDLEQALLELYFTKFHPYAPILHPASFIQDIKSGLPLKDDSFRILCLAVMAVSSRFSNDPRVFLDLDGNPVPCAGYYYAAVVSIYLLRPIAAPSNIHDLQATLLISLFALGSVSPDDAWDMIGIGLQKAQEVGAQLENSPDWSDCPIKNRNRRIAFFFMYELDTLLSSAMGKPASMQESDFDLLPPSPDVEVSIGIYINPFSPSESAEDSKVADDFVVAYQSLRVSLGGLKNLFPVIDVMDAQRDSFPGVKFSRCIESLVNELDASATKCYQDIALKFNSFEVINGHISDHQMIISVNAITYYHEFRLLFNRVLFDYKGGKNTAQDETQSTVNQQQGVSKPIYAHAEICVESARMILTLINRLHQRNLLDLCFFWVPLRLTNAIIILIASLKTLRKTLSVEQRYLRCSEITLGIQTLFAMAPSIFMAAKLAKMMVHYYESVLQQSQDHPQSSKKTTSSPPLTIQSSSFSSAVSSAASPASDPDPNKAASSIHTRPHLSAQPAFNTLGLPQQSLDGFQQPDLSLAFFPPFHPPDPPDPLPAQLCLSTHFSHQPPLGPAPSSSKPSSLPLLSPRSSDPPCDPHHPQLF